MGRAPPSSGSDPIIKQRDSLDTTPKMGGGCGLVAVSNTNDRTRSPLRPNHQSIRPDHQSSNIKQRARPIRRQRRNGAAVLLRMINYQRQDARLLPTGKANRGNTHGQRQEEGCLVADVTRTSTTGQAPLSSGNKNFIKHRD